jgi:hypothetical protein
MAKIDLTFFQEVGLVICCPSGVVYTNQSGGFGCFHPEAGGVFCPLPVKPGNAEVYALMHHFKGPWSSLTVEDADVVDRVLRGNGHTYLKVDRARLSGSYEAWVYVLIADAAQFGMSETFSGFGECQGILTWPNSD